MSTIGLLYNRSIRINDNISVVIPKIKEILEDEDAYYDLVNKLTAMPIDYMVQLDDAGIDFTEIDEYELFLMLFPSIARSNTKYLFGELDLSKFSFAMDEKSRQYLLIDTEHDIKIDRNIHSMIADKLRMIHRLEKNIRKPGNEEAKEYMISRERRKMKRRKRNNDSYSNLESLIVAMVNTEQFKYDYEGTLELSIYQFNESVRQIINKVDYENRMRGVYAGTIDPKDLKPDDFNWLTHK